MAKDLNKVMLIGRLGTAPELQYTTNGVAYCRFTLATNENYVDEKGNKVEKTEWHNIVAWRKLAETCNTYLKKGSKIFAEGKLQTNSYEKEGQKKFFTQIVLSTMIMLDAKPSDTTVEYKPKETSGNVEESPPPEEDDLPF